MKEPTFLLMGALCAARGLTPLNKHSGAIRVVVDDTWEFWINGSVGPAKIEGSDEPLPRFHAYVKYAGWPAGILNPRDGVLAAGEGANEETFRAALLKATEAA